MNPPPDPHVCDKYCACPEHRTQMIYSPAWDDHACQDVACEYGHGEKQVRLTREYRRAEWLLKDFRALEAEVVAGLSTEEHHEVAQGGLPFCKCGFDLDGDAGNATGVFITHALAVVVAGSYPGPGERMRQ